MKYDWIDGYLLAKKGVHKDFKPEWNWERYLIEDKMFAALCYGDGDGKLKLITFKLCPSEGAFLREQYADMIPGYYMNKEHWNSVKADGEFPDGLLRECLDKSYGLIFSRFSKKKQKGISG